jgi:hypothetical protein
MVCLVWASISTLTLYLTVSTQPQKLFTLNYASCEQMVYTYICSSYVEFELQYIISLLSLLAASQIITLNRSQEAFLLRAQKRSHSSILVLHFVFERL